MAVTLPAMMQRPMSPAPCSSTEMLNCSTSDAHFEQHGAARMRGTAHQGSSEAASGCSRRATYRSAVMSTPEFSAGGDVVEMMRSGMDKGRRRATCVARPQASHKENCDETRVD
jgi:enoyl-CoA hydratase/carnithine racemase